MTFDPTLRKEKPEKPRKPDREDTPTKKDQKILDKALENTFPASDPVASESPTTGTRMRKPKV